MKKIIGFITIVLLLQGCGNANEIQQSETVGTTYGNENVSLEVEEGVLFKATAEYSDVHDIGVPFKTGQSAIIRISREEFLTITQKELTKYLTERKKCKLHDWHAIIIDGNMAILCSYNQDKVIYGIWDENLGITENSAEYEDIEDVIEVVK